MAELIVSSIALLTAGIIHLAVWKIRVPKRQTRAILIIFLGLLATTILLLPTIARTIPALGFPLPVPVSSYLHLSIFMTACTLAYMITYTVIEVDSPSLVMAMAIHQAGAAGLPDAEFTRQMNNDLLVEPRLQDMLRDGLAIKTGDRYCLTGKGKRMARLFILHRRILGAGIGG